MFTVLIDESGDTGVHDVRADPSHGPSQYFTMCATIFRETRRSELLSTVEQLPFATKDYHSTRLSHFEKVHTCRRVAQMRVAMVGVISNKLSLGTYLREAKQTPTHFYNKVAQYLLERVGACLITYGISADQTRIVLEAREQRYSSLISFIRSIQQTPIDPRAAFLRKIDSFSITRMNKRQDPLFCLPDLGSHALFCCFRKDESLHCVTESRYLRELAPCFLADRRGRILPRGIKPIHSISDLQADPDIMTFLSDLSNPFRPFRRLDF
jgi:hypothetical protein